MSNGYEKIDERGSLTLARAEGVLFVVWTERPEVRATLRHAGQFFEISNGRTACRLNGSQVQTVKAWIDEHL